MQILRIKYFLEEISTGVYPEQIYIDGPEHVRQAADYINITDKNVLVIGTQYPWIEAILLDRKPRMGVTVEYSKITRLFKL